MTDPLGYLCPLSDALTFGYYSPCGVVLDERKDLYEHLMQEHTQSELASYLVARTW